MEGLEIGVIVFSISGVKSGFKTLEEAKEKQGVVVDYVFNSESFTIFAEVKWEDGTTTTCHPELLEEVDEEELGTRH